MGITKYQKIMRQLFDLEKSILQLKLRVNDLHQGMEPKFCAGTDHLIRRQFPFGKLFGGRKPVIRQNRRVERHAASLF